MKIILAFLILIKVGILFSQTKSDSLNQYNAKGKKHGFWKEYLTDYLIETKDTTLSYYFALNYYENGKLIIWTSGAQYYKKKAIRVESDTKKPEKGKPVLLNGHFKFYYNDGLGLDEIYKNGLPIYTATCAPDKDGNSVKTEIMDYTNSYNQQFGSFLYDRYKTDGTLYYHHYFGKNKKGKWTFIK